MNPTYRKVPVDFLKKDKDLTDKEWEKKKKENEKKRAEHMKKRQKEAKEQADKEQKEKEEATCPNCGHDRRDDDSTHGHDDDPDMQDGSDWEQEHSRD